MKSYYNSFDEYVIDYPEAEAWRNWVTDEPVPPDSKRKNISSKYKKALKHWLDNPPKYLLVHLTGFRSCLPGNYYPARMLPDLHNQYFVSINDGDDWYRRTMPMSRLKCIEKLEELKKLVPCCAWDLEDFGYFND